MTRSRTTFPDEQPWVPVADAVLRGEYLKADKGVIKSIVIGLRSISHPTCRKAHEFLTKKP